MIKKDHKTILSIVVVLLLIGLLLLALQKFSQKSTTSISTPPKSTIVLPPTVFDSTITVSSTHLSFSYPSKGFYGLGVRLFPQPANSEPGLIAGMATNPVAPFTDQKTSEYLVMNVSLFQNKEDLTPEEMLAALPDGSADKEAAKMNGKNIQIGTHRFFVYRGDEGVDGSRALATSTEGMVSISFSYTDSDKPESQAASMYNNELFNEALSYVSF